MTKPLVSILIPVYNTEKYLRDCLESVVNQTIESKEVVIVDDGSTDSSPQIIDEYDARYSFVRVVHQENMGLWKARCKLLSMAEGEYIAWVDSDDFAEKDMYERMINVALQNKVDLVLCNYSFYPSEIKTKEKWFKPFQGKVDWQFIERNTQPWNKIVRKDLLDRIDIMKWLPEGGDGSYSLVLITAKGIASIDNELYHYRVGHTSMSNNLNKVQHYENNVSWTKKQRVAAESIGLSKDWLEYFDYRVIYSLILTLIIAARNNEKEVYKTYQSEYKLSIKKKNPYTETILKNNHGGLKAFVILRIIPMNYSIARLITKLAL